MNYNPESGLWEVGGQYFIKNEFDPYSPCFVEVSDDYWTATWKGQAYIINWGSCTLPDEILTTVKTITTAKIMSGVVAATYLGKISQLLSKLEKNWPVECHDFSKVGIREFSAIWDILPAYSRSTFRALLTEIAESGKYGTDTNLAIHVKNWKSRSNLKTLRGVLEWDSQSGALTSAELALLRTHLISCPDVESDKDHALRLLSWTMIELLKRTQQFASIKADGLKIIENEGIFEYFLEVPKAKIQSGEPPELWKISAALGKEIVRFGERPVIRGLQSKHNRLFVWKSSQLDVHGQLSSANVETSIKSYILRLGLISPRTNEPLHVTPYRFRHTGATRMAAQGVTRDVIQHILEQDDVTSAQAYIDAIGSDLVPAIERADRNLGDLFKELNNIFFKGKVRSTLTKTKVFIPIFTASPMPVGSCGHDPLKFGQCKKQPFTACYNGCAEFLAWRDADHTKALAYVENELKRWNQVEGHNARSKAIKDFEQLHHAISEVIHKIEEGAADAVA